MPFLKLYFVDKSVTGQSLLDECVRWSFDFVVLANDDEGQASEAIIVLKGRDTDKYIKAIIELEGKLND